MVKRRKYLEYGAAMGIAMLAGCGGGQESSGDVSNDETPESQSEESADGPVAERLDVELYEVGENVEFSGDGTLMDTGNVRVEEAWVQNTAFLNPSGDPSVFGESGEVFIIFEFVFPDYEEENRNRFDSQYDYIGSIHAANQEGRYPFNDVSPAVTQQAGVFEGVRMYETERDTLLAVQSVDADLLGNDAEIVVLGDERNVGWDISDAFSEQEFAELVIEDVSLEERDDGVYGILEASNRTENAGIGRFVANLGDEEVWVERDVEAGETFTWEHEVFTTPDSGDSMFEVTTAFDEENVTRSG